MKKIFIPFIAIAIATLSSCNGEKRSDRWNSCNCRKIEEVSESDKGPFVSASGKAENSADLSTWMMGYVTKVYVQIGQKSECGTNIGKYQ
jgi:hypothetical protein